MSFNKNRIVVELDAPILKAVAMGRHKRIEFDGRAFDMDIVDSYSRSQFTLKPDVCRVRFTANGAKAHFDFGRTSFLIQMAHVVRVYEKETGIILWDRAAFTAPHIIIAFTNIFLRKGGLPIGEGIFVGVNCAIPLNWIESWTNQMPDAFIKLKSGCSIIILSSGKAIQVSYGKEDMRMPLTYVLEIYEKETGRRIWHRPIPATP